jgi:hypothetical protein
MGNPKNLIPIIYAELNDHTPLMVKSTSQNKKNRPVIVIPGHINFQLLRKATLLSNESTTGKNTVSRLMSK